MEAQWLEVLTRLGIQERAANRSEQYSPAEFAVSGSPWPPWWRNRWVLCWTTDHHIDASVLEWSAGSAGSA